MKFALLLFGTTTVLSMWLCAATEIRTKRSEENLAHSCESGLCDLRTHRLKNKNEGLPEGRANLGTTTGNCEPGKKWRNRSEFCTCSENGVVECSRALRTRRSENNGEEPCVPGARWKQDCNNCWCTENGIGVCTLMGCLKKDPQLIRRRRRSISDSNRFHNEYDNDNRIEHSKNKIQTSTENSANKARPTHNCVPGTSWKLDCNNCWCTENGLAACTYMLCLGSNSNHNQLNHHQHRQSKDLQNYISQHNRVRRSENHIEEIERRPERQPIGTCVPGTRWKGECNNNCWCSETGIAACTLMGCIQFTNGINHLTPHQSDRQSTLGSTNFENYMFQHRDANIRVRRSENECVPGTKWKGECDNDCWCTETGIGVCTKKGCLRLVDVNNIALTNERRKRSSSSSTRYHDAMPENESKCKHGTTWLNNCNRCRCIRGRSACTRMMCPDKKTN